MKIVYEIKELIKDQGIIFKITEIFIGLLE